MGWKFLQHKINEANTQKTAKIRTNKMEKYSDLQNCNR